MKKQITLLAAMLPMCILFNSCSKESRVNGGKYQNPGNGSNTNEESPFFKAQTSEKFVQNELLLQFKPLTSSSEKGRIFQMLGATVSEEILTEAMKEAGEVEAIYRMRISVNPQQAIGQLQGQASVSVAEPNFIYTYGAVSNDPYYTAGYLWGTYAPSSTPANAFGSQATKAWAAGNTGSSNVVVGIIDEGFMTTHEDLAANAWVNPYETKDGKDNDGNGYIDDINGWDFVNNDNTVFDGVGDDHGTHVAGTIGAVGGNAKGVAGVNWKVKMISCKFLGTNGGSVSNAIKAVDYITNLKTKKQMNIVATNNSWGGGGYSSLLFSAIGRANTANILFIAAAGNAANNNDATASYPASYTNANVIAVAAINSKGNLSSFSNYGATSVDLGAPGEAIYSTLPGGTAPSYTSTYGGYSGTSMATPHVTGAAALYAAKYPGKTAAAVKAAILAAGTATPSLSGKCATGKRLNVSTF